MYLLPLTVITLHMGSTSKTLYVQSHAPYSSTCIANSTCTALDELQVKTLRVKSSACCVPSNHFRLSNAGCSPHDRRISSATFKIWPWFNVFGAPCVYPLVRRLMGSASKRCACSYALPNCVAISYITLDALGIIYVPVAPRVGVYIHSSIHLSMKPGDVPGMPPDYHSSKFSHGTKFSAHRVSPPKEPFRCPS